MNEFDDFIRDKRNTQIYKVEQYNDTCYRIIKYNVNVFGKKDRKINVNDFLIKNDNDSLISSVSRSKRNIRRICLSNDFEYFVTWTINSEFADRFSVQSAEDKIRALLKDYQKQCVRFKNKIKDKRKKERYIDFKYIYVMEKHKDGAIHFHGLVKGMLPDDLKLYNERDFDKLPYYILDTIRKGVKIYYSDFFSNKLGYCTFTKIKNYNACCNYIVKYISKDPIRDENDNIYFCSRGLEKGQERILSYLPKKFMQNAYEYKNSNGDLICSVKDIYIDNMNYDTKLDFITSVIDNDVNIF